MSFILCIIILKPGPYVSHSDDTAPEVAEAMSQILSDKSTDLRSIKRPICLETKPARRAVSNNGVHKNGI